MTATIAIAHHAPLSGYFTGSFALRGKNGPATLRGPMNEIASAIKRTDETTVYRFDAFAQNWTPFRRAGIADLAPGEQVCDVPWADREGPELGFSVNSETLSKIMDLVPVAIAQGPDTELLPPPKMERIVATPNAHVFAFTWRGDTHYVDGFAEVEARAPFIRWTLIHKRYDGQPIGTMLFSWPWLTITRTIGFASIDPARITIMMSSDPSDIEQEAFRNAVFPGGLAMAGTTRIWRGVPQRWGGELFGQAVVLGSPRVTALVAAQRTNPRPWAGRDNPNATGVDPSFGSTWTAPIWPQTGAPDPRVIEAMCMVSDIYGARPCHWSEPISGGILRWNATRQVTLHKGQPYDRAEADVLKIGTQFRGTINGLETYDHEHRSIGPLAIFATLTGDHAAHYIADSYLAGECYERSVANGWVQAGRGQGLPWIAGNVLSRISTDEHLRSAWLDHDATRLQQYLGARLAGSVVTVGGLYQRGSPWSENDAGSYSDPYEQGTIVMALLLNGHLQEAYEHGKGLICGVWWENGVAHGAYNQRWHGGEWPHQIAAGQPINNDLAKSGDALGMWVGAGLRAFLVAANRTSNLGLDPVPAVRAAVRDLDGTLASIPDGELLAAAHRSLWETPIS